MVSRAGVSPTPHFLYYDRGKCIISPRSVSPSVLWCFNNIYTVCTWHIPNSQYVTANILLPSHGTWALWQLLEDISGKGNIPLAIARTIDTMRTRSNLTYQHQSRKKCFTKSSWISEWTNELWKDSYLPLIHHSMCPSSTSFVISSHSCTSKHICPLLRYVLHLHWETRAQCRALLLARSASLDPNIGKNVILFHYYNSLQRGRGQKMLLCPLFRWGIWRPGKWDGWSKFPSPGT